MRAWEFNSPCSKKVVWFLKKKLDFKESLLLFHPLPSVSVHLFDSCQTDVLLHLSKHQTKKSKQADCWIFNVKHLTARDTPDAFILYFLYTADLFDAAWTRANLSENVSEKVFPDKSALLETRLWADNKHTHNSGSQKQHLAISALQVLCTALILYRGFDGNACSTQVLAFEQKCSEVCGRRSVGKTVMWLKRIKWRRRDTWSFKQGGVGCRLNDL